jgi:hypothetical protein
MLGRPHEGFPLRALVVGMVLHAFVQMGYA